MNADWMFGVAILIVSLGLLIWSALAGEWKLAPLKEKDCAGRPARVELDQHIDWRGRRLSRFGGVLDIWYASVQYLQSGAFAALPGFSRPGPEDFRPYTAEQIFPTSKAITATSLVDNNQSFHLVGACGDRSGSLFPFLSPRTRCRRK